ncbi:MAG: MBL fold metallo-hydrolase, partial [Proteobacteria bacterium]|nr:MBL fold metallo-hydrolase [Pseudomonadota bacterium]
KWLLYRHSSEQAYLIKHHLVQKVNYLIITAHFSDHLDLESLNQFYLDIPIYTTNAAKETLTNHGFTNTITVKLGAKYKLGTMELEIFAAGSPYHTSTFAYKITADGSSVFHEPHTIDRKLKFDSVGACILTVDEVKVLGLIKVSMSENEAHATKARLNAGYMLATGIMPSRSKGFITWLLSITESFNSKRSVLSICNKTGDTLTL